MTEHMACAVQAENVSRTLSLGSTNIPVLNGLSFSVERSEWVALMGPSGSGKSTLLGIIAGLDTPTHGRMFIDGSDITHMKEDQLARLRNEKIGVVFQSFNLIPSLTAQENIEVPLYVHPEHRDLPVRARLMLERVGLGQRGNHQPHQLSGGEQQRVAIARALVTHPAILVADEPTGNLDSKTGQQILDLFTRLHQEMQITLIIATHDPAIAPRADRVIHLMDGVIVEGE